MYNFYYYFLCNIHGFYAGGGADDLYTFCLQNPDSPEVEQKKVRITEVGKEIFDDGGVDALENFFFAISNRIQGEIEKDIVHFRPLWNGLSDEWKY